VILYPKFLPCVSKVEGLSMTDDAGVVASPLEAGTLSLRRRHQTLPALMTLTWNIAQQTELAAWLTWCNANAWGWFSIALPGLAASRAFTRTAPVPVRFVSDVTQALMDGRGIWYWRVGVDAETQPSVAELAVLP
jgi:hypothetical protein